MDFSSISKDLGIFVWKSMNIHCELVPIIIGRIKQELLTKVRESQWIRVEY